MTILCRTRVAGELFPVGESDVSTVPDARWRQFVFGEPNLYEDDYAALLGEHVVLGEDGHSRLEMGVEDLNGFVAQAIELALYGEEVGELRDAGHLLPLDEAMMGFEDGELKNVARVIESVLAGVQIVDDTTELSALIDFAIRECMGGKGDDLYPFERD